MKNEYALKSVKFKVNFSDGTNWGLTITDYNSNFEATLRLSINKENGNYDSPLIIENKSFKALSKDKIMNDVEVFIRSNKAIEYTIVKD